MPGVWVCFQRVPGFMRFYFSINVGGNVSFLLSFVIISRTLGLLLMGLGKFGKIKC